ncbi:uncharacterized protein IUM83_00278 [Phytophthora cinnamomi]|uniref:uncharacterized protein n=1 Tax=Phytophthora cinnamomi TaxID=4785 RepID=UPI0035595386|nr:hypothetical protein IUM83_00278 [Phytophthora cinnamomi]
MLGKAPVASLDAEELAEKAAAAESEADDEVEDYVDEEEDIPDDDVEYDQATTPPATPRSKPSTKKTKARITTTAEKGKRKRLPVKKRPAKQMRTESPHVTQSDGGSSQESDLEFTGFSLPTQQASALAPPLAQETLLATPPRRVARSLDMTTSPDATVASETYFQMSTMQKPVTL